MTELLAESDFPAQGYFFILVAIFSFFKWLFTALSKRKESGADKNALDELYDQFRDEIKLKQSSPPEVIQQTYSPPALPRVREKSTARAKRSVARGSSKAKSIPAAPKATVNGRASFKSQLRHKNSLRRALILREILGKPKALQD